MAKFLLTKLAAASFFYKAGPILPTVSSLHDVAALVQPKWSELAAHQSSDLNLKGIA